jgi:hypothetical protein
VLRGRCACKAVLFEVSDEFLAAYDCHCSNCRAMTGSAFLLWGEIEREKLEVTSGAESLQALGDPGGDQEMRCRECRSLVYWTARERGCVRIPYGTLVDAPTLRPTRTCSSARRPPGTTSSTACRSTTSTRGRDGPTRARRRRA